MNFEELKNPELQEKLRGAKTPDELLLLAKEEGFELSDTELEGISGGSWGDICWDDCPNECRDNRSCPSYNKRWG